MRPLWILGVLCSAPLPQASLPATGAAPGGTRLVFRVDVPAAMERGLVRHDEAPPDVAREIAAVLRLRLDREEHKGGTVQEPSGLSITVDLPAMPPDAVDALIPRLANSGRVAMRMVADDEYRRDGVSFDLALERKRLQAWLAIPANRNAVLADPLAIHRFNAAAGSDHGPQSRFLHWSPEHAVRAPKAGAASRPTEWRVAHATSLAERIADLGPDQREAPGFVPLNLHEAGFTNRDLEWGRLTTSEAGWQSVAYTLIPERTKVFADLSGRNVGKTIAILCNDMVVIAPVFRSRIPGGRGEIALPGFSRTEAEDFVASVQGGALRAPLVLMSRHRR